MCVGCVIYGIQKRHLWEEGYELGRVPDYKDSLNVVSFWPVGGAHLGSLWSAKLRGKEYESCMTSTRLSMSVEFLPDSGLAALGMGLCTYIASEKAH